MCYWIYGATGTGKSRVVRERFPSVYNKAQNKWWDGYIGQKEVVIDDLDTTCLGHYLKIWSDRYKCSGEIKGAIVPLANDVLIVTSNWSIEELFEKEPKMVAPLQRRFVEVNTALIGW